MKNCWVVVDQYEVTRYREKHGIDGAEAALRRQLIKNGFDLREHIAITENYKGDPRYILYEQDKGIIESGEALKSMAQNKKQPPNGNGKHRR